ncbi:hypothetical protein C8R44DRAFT_866358 [Mycena epipterygia]|nr:hypothetical protein C8R44DRAFT_866358 [Mycena epipterygia]
MRAQLKQMAECKEFTYLEINSLRIPEPTAHGCVQPAVRGGLKEGHLRIGAEESCILLMDELNQLITPSSLLIGQAGQTQINFQPYTAQQLLLTSEQTASPTLQ